VIAVAAAVTPCLRVVPSPYCEAINGFPHPLPAQVFCRLAPATFGGELDRLAQRGDSEVRGQGEHDDK
jgi:hypothetical protein